MDLPLLRHLQFIKKLEDDPANEFKTGRIDLKSFTPRFSRVIVVDQRVDQTRFKHSIGDLKFGDLPPGSLYNVKPSKMRFIFHSLSWALKFISYTSQMESMLQGWTVILREGLYINGLGSQDENLFAMFAKGQPVEIVGLNEVRLLLLHDLACTFYLNRVNLIMRNVRVYDFRANSSFFNSVLPVWDTECQLFDVKMYVPRSMGPVVTGEGCALKMLRCTVNGVGFGAHEGGIIRAENCLFTSSANFPGIQIAKRGEFHALHVRFQRRAQISVTFKGTCFLKACHFAANLDADSDTDSESQPPLFVRSEGSLDCRRSTFHSDSKPL